jgi:hypothetical protein
VRRLKPGQKATVALDESGDDIDCRVASVVGSIAKLSAPSEIDLETSAQLSPGSLGYLTFTHDAGLVALRGVARAAPKVEGEVDFVVIDGIHLPERRGAERTPLARLVRVHPAGTDGSDAPTIDTVTADLSLGGAMLARRAGLREGAEIALDLFVGADAHSPVRCQASVVRGTPTHVGVRFKDMSEADQILLAGFLADHHLRRKEDPA